MIMMLVVSKTPTRPNILLRNAGANKHFKHMQFSSTLCLWTLLLCLTGKLKLCRNYETTNAVSFETNFILGFRVPLKATHHLSICSVACRWRLSQRKLSLISVGLTSSYDFASQRNNLLLQSVSTDLCSYGNTTGPGATNLLHMAGRWLMVLQRQNYSIPDVSSIVWTFLLPYIVARKVGIVVKCNRVFLKSAQILGVSCHPLFFQKSAPGAFLESHSLLLFHPFKIEVKR